VDRQRWRLAQGGVGAPPAEDSGSKRFARRGIKIWLSVSFRPREKKVGEKKRALRW
jgi:hypothetical protein